MPLLPALFASALMLAGPPPSPATAVLDTALARMGGAPALERIVRIRREMLTMWQRTGFSDYPYTDAPSYETHSDVRDYALGAWRNTRRFPAGGTWREITDIVRDSVAARRFNGAWSPLNVAYVDERRELFAFAPERVLLLARAAIDLRLEPDTLIAGVRHARLAATLDRFPTTLFVRRTDGLLAMARYRAGHPNDFGLVPWGVMEVEVWFSIWQRSPAGAVLPLQWDIRRVGRPYKRLTVLATSFDSVAAPDSFSVSDSLRAAFFATQNRPMHDVPLDSARIVEEHFATFNAPGAPAGAVRLGTAWILLEPGQAPLSAERAAAWLRATDPAGRLSTALVTLPGSANGGVAWLARSGITLHAAPGAEPYLRIILRNHGEKPGAATIVTAGRWLRAGGDSLWLEPMDLPDAPGALIVYAPSLNWAYAGTARSPFHADLILSRLRARGWVVDRLGSGRGIAAKAP